MIISSSIRATAHRNHPPGIRHLIVDLTQRGSHFVGQSTGYDHHVGLARGGTEDDAHAVLVVARGGEVHHFDGAAGEAEGHGPERTLARPISDLVQGCAVAADLSVLFALLFPGLLV